MGGGGGGPGGGAIIPSIKFTFLMGCVKIRPLAFELKPWEFFEELEILQKIVENHRKSQFKLNELWWISILLLIPIPKEYQKILTNTELLYWYKFQKIPIYIPEIFWYQLNTNTSLAAKGALANRLQRRTACKIQNGHQGAQKWPMGSGQGSTPRFWGAPVNFLKISFLIRALLLWET